MSDAEIGREKPIQYVYIEMRVIFYRDGFITKKELLAISRRMSKEQVIPFSIDHYIETPQSTWKYLKVPRSTSKHLKQLGST